MVKQQHFLTTQWPNTWLGLCDGLPGGPMCINLFKDIFTLFVFAANVLISAWVHFIKMHFIKNLGVSSSVDQ